MKLALEEKLRHLVRRLRIHRIRATKRLSYPEATFSVHILTCHSHVDMALWCLKSFVYFSECSPSITVHDDGSLNKNDIKLFKVHFPRCRVIVRLEADQRMGGILQNYPHCHRMRREAGFHCALKLFDPWQYALTDVVVLIDSDILFFRRPQQLLDLANEGKACFSSDYQNAYALKAEEIRYRMGIDVLDKVNAGILVLRRESYDLTLAEKYFVTFPEKISDLNRHEQTLYALLLSIAGADRLSPAYQISWQPIGIETVSHHFVSDGSREDFCGKGLKTLSRRGVLAAISPWWLM